MKKRLLPLAFLILSCLFSMTISNSVLAYAYHATPIGAGYNTNLISDAAFTAKNTMTVADIQNFMASKLPVCDTWGTKLIYDSAYGDTVTRAVYGSRPGRESAPYTCLKDYTEGGKTAAQIIKDAANDYDINPQVILVTLQKEQSLLTDDWPWQWNYNRAMGMACPESGGCDAAFAGFTNQARSGSRLLKAVYNKSCNPDTGPFYEFTYFNTFRGVPRLLDGVSTNIDTCATAALYQYTPHRVDSAWIDRNGENFYGNYNFVKYYNDWFSDWGNPPFTGYVSGPGVWLTDSVKFLESIDLNKDGNVDEVALYDYGKDKMGIWAFMYDGTYYDPILLYSAEGWNVSNTRFMTADDFNGDGKSDLAFFYDYGNGRMGLWTFAYDGTSLTPKLSYVAEGWNTSSVKFMSAGNINGDTRSDIVLLYNYGNDNMGIWTFTSDGTYLTPKLSYITSDWSVSSTKFMKTGTLNDDGNIDLALLYDYGKGNMGIWTFISDGTYFTPKLAYTTSDWSVASTKFMTAGDLNSDGKTDLALFYDYGNSTVGIWYLTLNGSSFVPTLSYSSRQWYAQSTNFMTYTNKVLPQNTPGVVFMYDYGNNIGLLIPN